MGLVVFHPERMKRMQDGQPGFLCWNCRFLRSVWRDGSRQTPVGMTSCGPVGMTNFGATEDSRLVDADVTGAGGYFYGGASAVYVADEVVVAEVAVGGDGLVAVDVT